MPAGLTVSRSNPLPPQHHCRTPARNGQRVGVQSLLMTLMEDSPELINWIQSTLPNRLLFGSAENSVERTAGCSLPIATNVASW